MLKAFSDTAGALGRGILNPVRYTQHIFLLFYLSFRTAIIYPTQGIRTIVGVISSQIYFTGFQALPLIAVMAVATGSVVAMQSSSQVSMLGGSSMMGTILVAVVLRELGPLITALIVISRSGVAVATEVGNMKVNREIEALESMGISPLTFIVFPRVVGGVISVICLGCYFVAISLLVGYGATWVEQRMPFHFYVDSVVKSIGITDLFVFFIKNAFSGVTIFVVSCYQGLSVQSSPHEVPQMSSKAVVNVIIYVVGFNLVVSAVVYFHKLMQMGVL